MFFSISIIPTLSLMLLALTMLSGCATIGASSHYASPEKYNLCNQLSTETQKANTVLIAQQIINENRRNESFYHGIEFRTRARKFIPDINCNIQAEQVINANQVSTTPPPKPQQLLTVVDEVRPKNPIDVTDFDIAGIKLRMKFTEASLILKRLQKRDGGKMYQDGENCDTDKYRIDVKYVQPYQYNGKRFERSVFSIHYKINNYVSGSGGKDLVKKKYGTPTLDHTNDTDWLGNPEVEYIEYCQNFKRKSDNTTTFNMIVCDTQHGASLTYLNGGLTLHDPDFKKFAEEHPIPPAMPDVKF